MIEWSSAAPKFDFHVRVGHMQVMVQGIDQRDAIRSARKLLCREMPRMWDVIQELDDTRFDVTRRSEN